MNEADLHQHIVDEAIGLEQPDPGINADQEAGPERQNHEEQQRVAPAQWRAHDAIGERIADQQAADRRPRREPERVEIGAHIEAVAEEELVIRAADLDLAVGKERRIRRNAHRLFGEADLQHDQERHQEEQRQPRIRRQYRRETPHRSSTTPASRRQPRKIFWPSARLLRVWRSALAMVARITLPLASAISTSEASPR